MENISFFSCDDDGTKQFHRRCALQRGNRHSRQVADDDAFMKQSRPTDRPNASKQNEYVPNHEGVRVTN